MSIFFKHFSMRVIIDADPSRFIFTRMDNNFTLSIKTFVYVVNQKTKLLPIAIGEEIPNDRIFPDVWRIDIFDSNYQLPLDANWTRDDVIVLFLEYGLGQSLASTRFPRPRPVVFILGADRLKNQLKNPRDQLEKLVKRSGASIVVFDKIEI